MRLIPPAALLASAALAVLPPSLRATDERRRAPEPRLNVAWDARPLGEVVRDLGTWLDVPFALTSALRDRKEEPVSLELRNVPASGLLGILRDQLDVRYVLSHGVVWVTTPADAVRRTAVLRVYDVRMLTTRPMAIPPPPEMGIPGHGFERDVEVEAPPAVDEEELADLLRTGTGGDEAWEWKGVSLRLVHGRLFVRHTPEVHARVLQILRALGTL